MISIDPATTAEDYAAFGALIRDYVAWLRVRCRDPPWFIDEVLGHQGLDRELDQLAVAYGPPDGRVLLARRAGLVCGGGAYRRLSADACEMKRLFVPAQFRGHGTGRRLCDALLAAAGTHGYRVMRLDSARHLAEAIALYRAAGFRDCAPYAIVLPRLLPQMVFMERSLQPG